MAEEASALRDKEAPVAVKAPTRQLDIGRVQHAVVPLRRRRTASGAVRRTAR